MAQKINPISLRLGKTNRGMDSCWFNQSNYVNLLMKDFKIQKYIDLILKKIKFSSARYSITYLPTKIKINVFFCNPSKNRKYVSKIFYLSLAKKHKIIKKNFFNSAHTGISVAQSKTFEYLTKNFNKNSPFLSINKDSINLLCKKAKITDISENKSNSKNSFLFQNYYKLLHCLKKYNEFSIRYFLVKYFSMKQSFYFTPMQKLLPAKHKALNVDKQKSNLKFIFSKSAFFTAPLYKNIFLQKEEKYFTANSYNNIYSTILFKYVIFFSFLKIYKNKNFLALSYLQTKLNNYKKITQNSNAFFSCLTTQTEKLNIGTQIFKKKQDFFKPKNQLKKAVYSVNSEKQNNCNEFNASIKIPIIFFFNTFMPLKLKILNFLGKKKLNHTFLYDYSIEKINTVNFVVNTNLEKKFMHIFTNGKNLFKLNAYYKQLQFSNKPLQENLIYSSSKIYFINGKSIDEKHCSLSLMNAECVNQTYNNYCKLFHFSKYYECAYLRGNKNFLSFHENSKFDNNINSSEICIQSNNDLVYSKAKLIKKKKFILLTSPYKSHMESILCNNFSNNVHLHFFQTSDIFKNALFLIDEIIYYIEKRVAFFKIKNYILKKITEQKSNNIKGIRVMCSGRIGGKSKKAQRSKIQNFKYGETSLHVFSSKIDFKSKNAFTSFGTLGIKIWICYN